jgi:hypothetical protein
VLAELEAAWEARWSNTPPVGFMLRDVHVDRWVRFHTLPESKRYPDSEDEYTTILNRHHTLLDELGLQGRCYAAASFFAGDDVPTVAPEESGVPNAERWRTVPPIMGEEMAMVVFAGEVRVPSPQLDLLLRDVIDDNSASITLIPPRGDWLYHPYDGGVDIIAPSVESRDALRAKHSTWLSSHPRGV